MIYYNDKVLLIRDMRQSDAQVITDEEIAQGWDANVEKYEMRLRHQSEGKSISLVAEYHGKIAGYINVYLIPNGGLLLIGVILKSLISVCWRNIAEMV